MKHCTAFGLWFNLSLVLGQVLVCPLVDLSSRCFNLVGVVVKDILDSGWEPDSMACVVPINLLSCIQRWKPHFIKFCL